MKKTILTISALLILAAAVKLSIVDAATFANPKTGDSGLGIILNESVYDCAAKILCALSLDDNGAMGDIKIPFTKNVYIVFEV